MVTRTSSRPNSSTARSTSAWAASVVPTGTTSATALPPASVIALTAASATGVDVVDHDGGAAAGEFGGVGEAEAPARCR